MDDNGHLSSGVQFFTYKCMTIVEDLREDIHVIA